jgi:hypothetical protein
LARCTFRIFEHLVQGTLPHIQHRLQLEMARGDFLKRSWLW